MAHTRLTDRTEAAAQRALQYRAEADRPRQRSASDEAGAPRLWTPGVRAAVHVERAAAGPAQTVRFEGMASVTGQAYEMYDWLGPYDEIVAVGAFERTLAQTDLDVPLVLDHVSSRRIARTGNAVSPLELAEITSGERTGLQVIAPTLQLSDPDTAYIVPKLESELTDEMSFRFTIEDGRWSSDFTTFTIREVNIHRGDVAIVGYGASPHTAGSGLRAQPEDKAARDRAAALSLAGDTKYARIGR